MQLLLQLVRQFIEFVVAIDLDGLLRRVVGDDAVLALHQMCPQFFTQLFVDVVALKKFIKLRDEFGTVQCLAPSAVASFVERK